MGSNIIEDGIKKDNEKELVKLIKDTYLKCISENDNGIEFINLKKYNMNDILDAKEHRVHRQNCLMQDYFSPLISMRVNYPGIHKNNYTTFRIMKELCPVVINEFKNKIMYKNLQITAEGPVLTLIVNENVRNIKKSTVKIEEGSIIGRCVDIDVYDIKGNSISRKEFGLKSRKCYICNENANVCCKTRKHNIEEIEKNISDRLNEYLKMR